MRILTLGAMMLLGTAPVLATAETFAIDSVPNAVTIYPDAAKVTRTFVVDLPKGRHLLRVSDLPGDLLGDSIGAKVESAVLTGQVERSSPMINTDAAEGSKALQFARDVRDTAQNRLAAQIDREAQIIASIDAVQGRIAFLEGQVGTQLTLSDIQELGQIIEDDGTQARLRIAAMQNDLRVAVMDRPPLERVLAVAQAEVDRLKARAADHAEVELAVTVAEAGPVSVTLDYFVLAGWQPYYEWDYATDTGVLTLDRKVQIRQGSGEDWQDVELIVTTVDLERRVTPSTARGRRIAVEDEAVAQARLEQARLDAEKRRADYDDLASPVIVEEAAAAASAYVSDVGVTYEFASPATIGDQANASLAFDTLQFDAELVVRAVPSRDDTAFRTLSFINTSGEPLLYGDGLAFLDGELMGPSGMEDAIEANQEVSLGYGPIHGLLLEDITVSRQSGDRGVISRETQQDSHRRLTLTNLTDRDWDVTVAHGLPYSEQDILTVTPQIEPAPDRVDAKDRRGVLEWDISVPTGQAKEIDLNLSIRWPEGYVRR